MREFDFTLEAKLLDAHTHQPQRQAGIFEIESPDLRKMASNQWQVTGPFVVGLHPWHIEQFEDPKRVISEWIDHPDCLGVGETGLDKNCKVMIDIQVDWVKFHFDIAMRHQKKLVVLHMVRGWDRLRKILQATEFNGSILIHDCQASVDELSWLEKDSRIWFSYGSALTRPNSKGFKGYLAVSEERLLFETDDSSESLLDVVARANGVRQLSDREIIEQEFLRKILR